jgi:hypothetical protein
MILMLPAVNFCNLKSLIVVLQSIIKSNMMLNNYKNLRDPKDFYFRFIDDFEL